MKGKILILGIMGLFLSFKGYSQDNSLSGYVMYKNSSNTPMHDSTFVFLKQNNVVFATDTVDSTGYYEFNDIPAGTYVVSAGCIKKWGGGNATDALLILRHFVGMQPQLSGLNLVVGDVNQSGGVPASVDALAVSRRFIGMISSFAPAPDWYSTKHTKTIAEGDTLTQNIMMLCAGDVNGSNPVYW